MNDLLIRLNKLGFQVEIEWGPMAKRVEIKQDGSFDILAETAGKTPEIALNNAIDQLIKKKLISLEKVINFT